MVEYDCWLAFREGYEMTQDEIIRMAREAGFSFETGQDLRDNIPALERFAALVAAHEREACCSGDVVNASDIGGADHPHQVVAKYQAAIRARGEK